MGCCYVSSNSNIKTTNNVCVLQRFLVQITFNFLYSLIERPALANSLNVKFQDRFLMEKEMVGYELMEHTRSQLSTEAFISKIESFFAWTEVQKKHTI